MSSAFWKGTNAIKGVAPLHNAKLPPRLSTATADSMVVEPTYCCLTRIVSKGWNTNVQAAPAMNPEIASTTTPRVSASICARCSCCGPAATGVSWERYQKVLLRARGGGLGALSAVSGAKRCLLRAREQSKRSCRASGSSTHVLEQRQLQSRRLARVWSLALRFSDFGTEQKGWVPPPTAHRCLRKLFSGSSPRRDVKRKRQKRRPTLRTGTLCSQSAAGLPSARRGEADDHGPRKDPPASAEPRKAPGPLSNASAPATSHAARSRPFTIAPGRGLGPEAPRTRFKTEPARSRGSDLHGHA